MLTSDSVLEARFTVTKFREGYEQGPVTGFLTVAGAALAAWETAVTAGRPVSAAGLSADEVAHLRLPTTKFDNGFDQDEVDDLLERVVAALREYEAAPVAAPVEAPPADLLHSSSLADATFTTTRFRTGYSIVGVDGFLAAARELIAAYETTGEPPVPAPFVSADVVNVRFTTTSWRRGYEQNEVGELLTRIIATLAYYERVAAAR
ncbi:DivIVA domain-containing protein [Conyzicola sp.]|uniref:DivIVA domain-containing protein n=1 Tax=Conyzicola sp. TaxID=1969404 RepID=UPI0039891850